MPCFQTLNWYGGGYTRSFLSPALWVGLTQEVSWFPFTCCRVGPPRVTSPAPGLLAQCPTQQPPRATYRGREHPSRSRFGKQPTRGTRCAAVLPSKAAGGGEGMVAVRSGDQEDEVPFGTAIVLPELDHVLWKESAGECFAVVCSLSHPGKISHRTEQVHYVPCLLI